MAANGNGSVTVAAAVIAGAPGWDVATQGRRPPDSLLRVEGLGAGVREVLEGVLARQASTMRAVDAELSPLVEVIAGLLRGGKRLRAAFCYWGWRGAGGRPGAEVVRAAAALELFHAAALLHDDVMDGSDLRRGRPTAHRWFERRHREQRLHGDPVGFGAAAAVLAGDLCLSWSDELFWRCGLAPGRLARGRAVFDLMRTQVMGGQFLDLLEQARGAASVERARAVVRWKSARYTVEQPLLLGAALAGAPAELVAAYSEFGLPLGEAFQLRDDVLGVFGDPERTGKPAGDDLREGKQTVLVALARRRATQSQRAVLDAGVGDAGLTGDGVDRVRGVLVDTGALAEVEHAIQDLTGRALRALGAAPVDPVAAAVLTELAHVTTRRVA